MKSRWNGLYVAGLYVALRTAVMWCSPPGYEDYRAAAGTLALSLCILSALAMCFYKAFCPITVFLLVSFQAVMDISSYVAVILVGKPGNKLPNVWNWCVREGIITSEKSLALAVWIGTVVVLALQYLAITSLLYVSLKKIVQNFQEKNYGVNRTELLFILTPSAVGMMICMLLRIIMVTVEDGIPKMLYERYPILTVVIPAILLLSLLSILYGVKLFQDMACWNREKSGRIVLENQISSLQEHMEEMERIYSGIRGMKHDMKNTLAVIHRLFTGEGNGELQEYLSELSKGLEKLEVRFRTGNTVVDTLLNMKYHEAVRDVPGLRMDADKMLLPQAIGIHSYDIGVILGNAVDNAIEACRKMKAEEPGADAFIRISSLQKGKLLILKVENSFDGRLVWSRQEEFPVTDKADRENHGIGLANIKSTAEKYQGTMDFKVKGKVFILSVMMKNEKEDDSMAISGIGSNYNNVYGGTYAAQKNDAGKKAETKEAAPAQAGKAKDTREKAVSNYYSYLQKNYGCMSNGSVAISSAYLKKCSGDSAKAKELEDFLEKIPELEKQGYEQLSAQNKALGGTVTYYQQTWMVHTDGSIQSTVYSVTETEMDNAERMKKIMDERLEKQKEKKEEEKIEEKKEEKAEQAEKLDGGTKKGSVPGAPGQEMLVRYVEAESELEAKAMMQKEKLKDAYYPKFDKDV